jgi:2-polyprenyl-6-methoxyphenol hydroxylase-like FAD-dependent oxidoreductase
MAVPSHPPVLVVGAGPVGLLAAAELARRDVPVRIIDQLPAPTAQARAIVVHAGSLEMLDQLGLAGSFRSAGVTTTAMEMHAGARRLGRFDLDRVDSPFPYAVTLAQTETERILTEFLAAHGVVVERGRTRHRAALRSRPRGCGSSSSPTARPRSPATAR